MKQNQIANYKDESQAYDGEFECFRLLNRSQFVTSSRISSLVNWNLYLSGVVANPKPRRNKSAKKAVDYLEPIENPLTFASVI